MSRKLTLPFFPSAPEEYAQQYMAEIVRLFSLYVTQMQNPGEGRNTKLVFTAMPTSDTGLEPGTLYRIGNDVKISLLNIAGVDGNLATTSLGTVTVSVS